MKQKTSTKPAKTKTARPRKSGPASAEGRRDPRGPDDQVPAAASPIIDRKLLLSQKLCAVVFGISSGALGRWRVKPREQRGRESLYYLPDLVDYRLHRDQGDTKLNLGDERARLASAQANRAKTVEAAALRKLELVSTEQPQF